MQGFGQTLPVYAVAIALACKQYKASCTHPLSPKIHSFVMRKVTTFASGNDILGGSFQGLDSFLKTRGWIPEVPRDVRQSSSKTNREPQKLWAGPGII